LTSFCQTRRGAQVAPVCVQIAPQPGDKVTPGDSTSINEIKVMLHYAVLCFVVAVLAAMYGFSGIPVLAAEIAKAVFFTFIVLFLATLTAGVLRRRR